MSTPKAKRPVAVPEVIDRLISQAEFAESIKRNLRDFQRWRDAGKIPPPDSPPGEHPKWRASTVNRYIQENYSHGQRISTP